MTSEAPFYLLHARVHRAIERSRELVRQTHILLEDGRSLLGSSGMSFRESFSLERAFETQRDVVVGFLKADLSLGKTFAVIAEQASDSNKRLRNQRNAQTAYDCVVKIYPRYNLSPSDKVIFREGLNELKGAVTRLERSSTQAL